jgi:DhnA family fructose-bisphosphate aldolase class Ia
MTERRMKRIFRHNGKVLIVAMDHGLIDGPCKGLEDPGKTITLVAEGGADAVLVPYGVAHHFTKELAPLGLIMRTDGGPCKLGDPNTNAPLFFTLEAALRIGADALAVSAFPGGKTEVKSLENLAEAAREAHRWGMPVMAEMVPGGFDSAPELRSAENVALASRVGVDLGADFIKTPYAKGFEKVINGCYKPVVILGGAKKGSEQMMLADIYEAVKAGASGVAIGRNIFQADDPKRMTQAVVAILHHDATVAEAMSILEGK